MRQCLVLFALLIAFCIRADAFKEAGMDEGILFVDFPDVITLSKRSQTQEEAPGIVTVFTARQMEELGIRTINDALRLIPGFEVVFGPRREYVYTRGIIESALVLFDGVPIVSPMDNEIFLDEAFGLDMIDRIEVIRGPGGVLWGATAFMGVINIVTREAVSPEGSLKVGYDFGSNDTRRTSLNFNKKTGRVSVIASYSELFTKDYVLKGDQWRSPYTARWGDGYENRERKEDSFRELFLKLKYKDITFTGRFADEMDYFQADDRGRTTAPNYDLVDRDPVKELMKLEYSGKYDMFSLSSRIWTVFRESYLTGLYGVPEDPKNMVQWIYNTWNVRKSGMEAEIVSDRIVPRNTFLLGAAYIEQKGTDIYTWDQVLDWSTKDIDPKWFFGDWPTVDDGYGGGGFGWMRPTLAVYAGPGENIRSFFATDTYDVTSRLSLSLGYRYDHNSAYEPMKRFNGNAVYQFIPGHFLKYMYAEGYRPADWEQKYSRPIGGGPEGSFLDPEESSSHDIQYNARIGDRLAYFLNQSFARVNNLIALDSSIGTKGKYVNTGEIDVTSSEAGLKYFFPGNKGYVFSNYSYKHVFNGTLGQRIPYLADTIANVGLYRTLLPSLATSITAHYESEKQQELYADGVYTYSRRDPKVMRTIDPFVVINWGVHYKLENLKASLFVYNLFDHQYYMPAFPGLAVVKQPVPQRSFMVKASYSF